MPGSPTTSERDSSWASDRGSRAVVRWIAFILVLSGASCRYIRGCGADGAPVVRIDVIADDPSWLGEGGPFDRRALELTAKSEVDRWPGYAFRLAEPKELGWQLTATLRLVTERTAIPTDGGVLDPDRVHRAVGVTMTLRALGDAPGEDSFGADALVSRRMGRAEPFQTVAEAAIRKVGQRLEVAMKLSEASDEQLVAALSSSAAHQKAVALDLCRRRRLVQAVPALTKMVRNPDEEEELVLLAIGALVEIGDPGAVEALIDAARWRSAGYLRQIIFAVSSLGGRNAEGYLFTLKSGHPDPAIREVAGEALDELLRRREESEP